MTQRLARKAAAAPTVAPAAIAPRSASAVVEGARAGANYDDPFGLHLPQPVQARASGSTDPDTVPANAMRGVEGPGQALPHHGAIQTAFGHHDVRAVRAHVGGAAAEAASAIGAEAYATGSDVAFARQPDLHTAAHEAAHVVQQRAGVQLYGRVGAAGDRYEQHADRVADGVVAGRSVEALLDTMTSSGVGPAAPAVQRSPRAVPVDEPAGADVVDALLRPQSVADAYAARHWDALRADARAALLATDLALDAPMAWRPGSAAERADLGLASMWPAVQVRATWDAAFARDLDQAIELGVSVGATRQAQIAPDDDRLARYHPAVGTAVGNTLIRRLRRSLGAIGPDYLARYQANGGVVDTSLLPVSSVSDRAAVALLAFAQIMGPLDRPRRQPRPIAGRARPKRSRPGDGGAPTADADVTDAATEAAAERVNEQLLLLAGLLGEANLEALAPAYAFVAEGPGGSPATWQPAVIRQAQQLELIRGEVLTMSALEHREVSPALKADALAAYARAAGGAHLPQAARLLRVARDEVADLDRRAAMAAAVSAAQATEARAPAEVGGAELADLAARADRATRGERAPASNGSSTAPSATALLAAGATGPSDQSSTFADDARASRAGAFRHGALRLADTLAEARAALASAGELVAGMFTAAVARDVEALATEVAGLEGALHQLANDVAARAGRGGVGLVADTIIAEAEARFRHFVKTSGVMDMGRRVHAMLARVERAVGILATVGFALVMIGASVAGGLAGAYVGGAVRGALTPATMAAVGETTTTAVVGGAVAAVATESAVVGGIQAALTGDPFVTAAGENLVAAGFTLAALSGVRWAGVLARARTPWAGSAALRFLGPGALDLAVGMGANIAAHSLFHPDDPASDDQLVEWTTAATTMVIGRWIGTRLRGLHARLDAIGARHGQDVRLSTDLAALHRELGDLETKLVDSPRQVAAINDLLDGQLTSVLHRIDQLDQAPAARATPPAREPLRPPPEDHPAAAPSERASVSKDTATSDPGPRAAVPAAPYAAPEPAHTTVTDAAGRAGSSGSPHVDAESVRGAGTLDLAMSASPAELLAQRPPLARTFEHALHPQLYIDDIVAHYRMNLRGVKALYDPTLESGKLGVTRASEGGMVIRIGRDAFVDQPTLANTIAHELSHARDYQRGIHKPHGAASSDGDGSVYGAGNALERWIRNGTGEAP